MCTSYNGFCRTPLAPMLVLGLGGMPEQFVYQT